MLEDPVTPVFLGLTDIEWHAFGYGLKEGFRFWKRQPLAWDEANQDGNAAGRRKGRCPRRLLTLS